MFTLTAKQREQLKKLCEKFQIKFIVAFGSYVRGGVHAESDLDIAVYPAHAEFDKASIDIEQKLAEIFKFGKIDLVNLKVAGPLLQKEAVFNGQLLYSKDYTAFELFQLYAIKAYYDFVPYLKLRENTINNRLKSL